MVHVLYNFTPNSLLFNFSWELVLMKDQYPGGVSKGYMPKTEHSVRERTD